MSLKRSAYLFVRDLSGSNNCPSLPSDWRITEQDNKWCTIKTSEIAIPVPSGSSPLTRSFDLASWRANTDQAGTRGLFLILCDEPRFLDYVAELGSVIGAPIRNIWQARNTNSTALAVLRRWPTWRIDGFIRDGDGNPVAVSNYRIRLMNSEGYTLPNPNTTPLPWNLDSNGQIVPQAQAVVRVTNIHGMALDVTIAGFQDADDAELTTSGSV